MLTVEGYKGWRKTNQLAVINNEATKVRTRPPGDAKVFFFYLLAIISLTLPARFVSSTRRWWRERGEGGRTQRDKGEEREEKRKGRGKQGFFGCSCISHRHFELKHGVERFFQRTRLAKAIISLQLIQQQEEIFWFDSCICVSVCVCVYSMFW